MKKSIIREKTFSKFPDRNDLNSIGDTLSNKDGVAMYNPIMNFENHLGKIRRICTEMPPPPPPPTSA
ncbi:unnamed protein product [Trichobilharzia regenti]|nr:unnamed protein product [Trichobilharzia regenti]